MRLKYPPVIEYAAVLFDPGNFLCILLLNMNLMVRIAMISFADKRSCLNDTCFSFLVEDFSQIQPHLKVCLTYM